MSAETQSDIKTWNDVYRTLERLPISLATRKALEYLCNKIACCGGRDSKEPQAEAFGFQPGFLESAMSYVRKFIAEEHPERSPETHATWAFLTVMALLAGPGPESGFVIILEKKGMRLFYLSRKFFDALESSR